LLAALAFVLAAVAVTVVLHLAADRSGIPAAALLTLAGLTYGLLPGPNVELDPDVILTFVLPPLLYSAALNASLIAIRQNLRAVVSLSVLLVLVTALLVGIGLSLWVPGITLAAGIALGGAVAPPDPVAALSVGRRAGLPSKLVTLIEGEGLLNDATALTILTVAVTAAVSGSFSFGFAVLYFLLVAAGGLVVGVAVGLVNRVLRPRIKDPVLVNCVSLATPFAAYGLAEVLHVSGVLAVVIAGLIVGHDAHRYTSGASRLQTGAVWRLVDLLLEGFVFLLIGEQLPVVIDALQGEQTSHLVVASAVTLAVVLGVRPLWLILTQLLPSALHARLGGDRVSRSGRTTRDSRLDCKEVLTLSWAGTRGVISLAAIFTLPLATNSGEPFPGRDILLFCTYLVVLVTLVGQGSTFAPLVRALGLRSDAADAAKLRNEARAGAVEAAEARLDQLVADGELTTELAAPLQASLQQRLARYRSRLDLLENADTGEIPRSRDYETAVWARREMITAQREELLRWRDAGRLPDLELRILENELDHQERVLPDRPTGR
jgi:CPA1 family monovalent cation:H+ antiporter